MPDRKKQFEDDLLRLSSRGDGMAPSSIVERLSNRYSSAEIALYVADGIRAACKASRGGKAPSQNVMTLGQASLALAAAPSGARISTELATDAVTSLDPIIWHLGVEPVVARYLTDEDLLRAILKQWDKTQSVEETGSLCAAIRLYLRAAQRSSNRAAVRELAQRLSSRISDHRNSHDPNVASEASAALQLLAPLAQ